MKGRPNVSRLGLLFVACSLVPLMTGGQVAPERDIPAEGEIDPYTVVLYRGRDYHQAYATFRLEPGRRMLKVPELERFPKSILLGSKVAALLFLDDGFHTDYTRSSSSDGIPRWLYPYTRVTYSQPRMKLRYSPHDKGSLVLHRKDIGDFLGVVVWDQFYALPDDAAKKSAIHHKIPTIKGARPFGLDPHIAIVPGGTGVIKWPHGHPRLQDIEVTVTGEAGVRTLPQGNETQYVIDDLGVGMISSVRIDYLGPYEKSAYLPPPVHRAPPAPDREEPSYRMDPHGQDGALHGAADAPRGLESIERQPDGEMEHLHMERRPEPEHDHAPPDPHGVDAQPRPGIAGVWRSTIGRVYHVSQTEDGFEWQVEDGEERGWVHIEGDHLHARWEGPTGEGEAEGVVVDVERGRRATRIEWSNGVEFFRD